MRCFIGIDFQYAIKKFHHKHEEMELDGTYQFLVYGDDVKILAQNTNTVKRTQVLLEASGKWVWKETQETVNSWFLSFVTGMQNRIVM
jgi:hypothetical protein